MVDRTQPDPIYHELRQLRQAAHISQQALADALGVHRTYLSHWERSIYNPALPRIRAWAQALGYDLRLVLLAAYIEHGTRAADFDQHTNEALNHVDPNADQPIEP